jgi:hypothetical protein
VASGVFRMGVGAARFVCTLWLATPHGSWRNKGHARNKRDEKDEAVVEMKDAMNRGCVQKMRQIYGDIAGA